MASRQGLSDIELMARTAQGDHDAFEQLVERHQRSVLNTAYRLISDPSTAEDLAQDVFLSIFRAAKTYKPIAGFRTWLFRIVRNECYNELRRRARHPIVLDGADPEHSVLERTDERATDPFDSLTQEERAGIVRKAISNLPPAQRMAVILRRYEGMSYKDIAEAMDNTVPAVKSLLSRAREGLAQSMRGYFGKPPA